MVSPSFLLSQPPPAPPWGPAWPAVCSLSRSCGITRGLHGDSDSEESACNVGDPGSIPLSGRSPGEGNGKQLQYSGLSEIISLHVPEPLLCPLARPPHTCAMCLFYDHHSTEHRRVVLLTLVSPATLFHEKVMRPGELVDSKTWETWNRLGPHCRLNQILYVSAKVDQISVYTHTCVSKK